MIYALQLVTAPLVEPVSLDEAKTFLRIDPTWSTDDDLIDSLIKSARLQMEAEYNAAFVPQTWKMFLDSFPGAGASWFATGCIELPKSPAISVTHVKYYDTNDAQQTLVVNTNYLVDVISRPARITLPFGAFWPSSRWARTNAVEIQFVCGYSDAENDADAVPAEIKRELMIRLTQAYEHRDGSGPPNFAVGRWAERRINI